MSEDRSIAALPEPDLAAVAAEPTEVLSNVDDVEVSVVDDTPEEDQNRPSRAGGGEEDDIDESQFSGRIRKRIDKLRYEWNEERRNKEKALRENTEAVRYAQTIQGENEALKGQLIDQRKLLYDQVSAKNDAEIDGAKRRYREAYEAGDADSITEAQSELSRLHAEKSHVMYAAPPAQEAQPVQQVPPQQAPAVPPPDPLAVDWLKSNPWFQQPGYEEVTGFAIGVHEKLVKQGFDPRGNVQYYQHVNEALRTQFPDKFGKEEVAGNAPTSRKTPVVAPAKRGGGKARKVELTSTQVSLARKLGLTPEQYAQQLVKEMGNG
jgi:hypothetical protein